MKNKIKKHLIAGLLAIVVISVFTIGIIHSNNSIKTACAESVDYTAQTYTTIPAGFNVASEDVIFKISCKNPRTQGVSASEVEEYVTILSFNASSGCQIYFVDGKVCNLEDIYFGDDAWNRYSNYYEILHYDSTNQFMYLKFRNLSNLESDENVSGTVEDISFRSSYTTHNPAPQYLYISQIQQPITEITENDVFFSSEILAGNGAHYATGYNIYTINFTLKLSQQVAHLPTRITFSMVHGIGDFTLYNPNYQVDEGQSYGSYIEYTCTLVGQMDSIVADAQVKAVITYGDKSITVMSAKTNLITLWQSLVTNNFAGEYYAKYLSQTNKDIITKFASSYSPEFFSEIKGSQSHFATYDKNNTLKINALIFRMPIANFYTAEFTWKSSYYQGETYYGKVLVDSNFIVSTSVYRRETNLDGSVEFSLGDDSSTATTYSTETYAAGDTVYNTTAEKQLLDATDIFAYNGYFYLRIRDYSMVEKFFPQIASSYFSAEAKIKGGSNNVLEATTASVIYDDYNRELLIELDKLSRQIAEMQEQLEESNLLTESQKEQILQLSGMIEGMKVDNSYSQNEIDYLNQQMDVMRKEYQSAIDQLIQENGGTPPSFDTSNNQNTGTDTIDSEDEKTVKMAALMMGAFLVVAIVLLLIPIKRRKRR